MAKKPSVTRTRVAKSQQKSAAEQPPVSAKATAAKVPSINPGFDGMALLTSVGAARSSTVFQAKQMIFRQGDPADAVYYIKTGKVQIMVTSEHGKVHSDALGEITGHVRADDLLGHIFSSFCIGK